MVSLYGMDDPDDISELMTLIGKHYAYTGSQVAARILDNPEDALRSFVKVYPDEYRKALERIRHEHAARTEEVEVAA
jgi:glutamate synthase domain-containing protein 3